MLRRASRERAGGRRVASRSPRRQASLGCRGTAIAALTPAALAARSIGAGEAATGLPPPLHLSGGSRSGSPAGPRTAAAYCRKCTSSPPLSRRRSAIVRCGSCVAGREPGAEWSGAARRDLGTGCGPGRRLRRGASPGRCGAVGRVPAEIEMWVHGHPLEPLPARRGGLPVSSFWLWGGGAGPSRPRRPGLRAPDGVCRSAVSAIRGFARSRAHSIPSGGEPAADCATRLATAATVASSLASAARDLAHLHAAWLAPARAALAAGRSRV